MKRRKERRPYYLIFLFFSVAQAEAAVLTSKLKTADENVAVLERRVAVAEPKAERVEETHHKVNQLTQQLLLWEADTRQHQRRKAHLEAVVLEAHEKDRVIAAWAAKCQDLRLQLECADVDCFIGALTTVAGPRRRNSTVPPHDLTS